jgi:hypothetical protein
MFVLVFFLPRQDMRQKPPVLHLFISRLMLGSTLAKTGLKVDLKNLKKYLKQCPNIGNLCEEKVSASAGCSRCKYFGNVEKAFIERRWLHKCKATCHHVMGYISIVVLLLSVADGTLKSRTFDCTQNFDLLFLLNLCLLEKVIKLFAFVIYLFNYLLILS